MDLNRLIDTQRELAETKRLDAAPSTGLSEDQLGELERQAGFALSPTLRALFLVPGAMPEQDVGGNVFGMTSWVGTRAIERNREVLEARAKYGWDLPKFVVISADEDFFAVTEEGNVIRVNGTEGNVSRNHGALDGFLDRYVDALDGYHDAINNHDEEDGDEDLDDFVEALNDAEADFCRSRV